MVPRIDEYLVIRHSPLGSLLLSIIKRLKEILPELLQGSQPPNVLRTLRQILDAINSIQEAEG